MTAIAGVIFPKQAQGQPDREGRQGRRLRPDRAGVQGRTNTFHGRPSATLAPDPADSTKTVSAPYNAANSGGSNLGPTSKALNDRVKEDVEKLKAENSLRRRAGRPRYDVGQRARSGYLAGRRAVPSAARRQARNMPEDRVRQLVSENTKGPVWRPTWRAARQCAGR
jgi:K+-transporting ATPase ATPase C chain